MEYIMPNINAILSNISTSDIKKARNNTIKMYDSGVGGGSKPLRMIAFDNAMTGKGK